MQLIPTPTPAPATYPTHAFGVFTVMAQDRDVAYPCPRLCWHSGLPLELVSSQLDPDHDRELVSETTSTQVFLREYNRIMKDHPSRLNLPASEVMGE